MSANEQGRLARISKRITTEHNRARVEYLHTSITIIAHTLWLTRNRRIFDKEPVLLHETAQRINKAIDNAIRVRIRFLAFDAELVQAATADAYLLEI